MRVGITGHRRLADPTAWPWVNEAIRGVLCGLEGPLLGVSSLAAGADQRFAEAVLEHGGELEAVIPFEGYGLYLSDSDLAGYERLLAAAGRVEYLVRTGSDEEAFFAAGKAVVDRVELLIAVWNGAPAKGLGGTGDAVEYALEQGLRVVQLDPRRREIRVL